MTSNGMLPSVLVLGRWAGGGDFAATTWNLLQPQQFLIVFISLGRQGTQYFSCTLAIVRPIPPCSVAMCSRTSLVVNRAESGKYIGYSPWICPLHSHTSSQFNCRLSCPLSLTNVIVFIPWHCVLLTHHNSWFPTYSMDRVPLIFSEGVKIVIYLEPSSLHCFLHLVASQFRLAIWTGLPTTKVCSTTVLLLPHCPRDCPSHLDCWMLGRVTTVCSGDSWFYSICHELTVFTLIIKPM